MSAGGAPTAVVTGGGSGIGAACAAHLARSGLGVVLVGRRNEPLERVASALTAAGGVARVFPADVRDWARLGDLHDELAAGPGRVDVVVNAAGGQFAAPAEEISLDGWRAVVETNLTGTFIVCRSLFPLLRAHGGAVVNVVANLWQGAAPRMAHSGAARAGAVSLTRTLAVEWAAHGIRVNAVSPGITDTAALRAVADPVRLANRVPLRRPATVEEIADAVMFLVGSTYTTGEVLTVDGGLHLV